MDSFHISQQAHREILDFLCQSKKIAAIKVLRRETKTDLRSAKNAIDLFPKKLNVAVTLSLYGIGTE